MHTGHPGYYQPQPSSFAPVYYPVGHHADIGQQAGYDNRKRGYEALNDFFGDAKRRQIDASSYPQVGQRLMALHGLPIHGGQIAYDMPAPQMVSVGGHGGHSMPQPHYGLPMPIPNLRTKSDLINIDSFLDQMQSTVYESSTTAAAAGIHLPGAHYTHAGMNFRQSHSPPQSSQHLGALNTHQTMAPMMNQSHSPQASTPALTPPSSSMSYTSGNSPISMPGLSPSSRHSSTTSTAAYPILPAVTSAYSSSNTAPVSTLGTNFDTDPRRRFSGGMLQRAAAPREEMEVSVDAPTPTKQSEFAVKSASPSPTLSNSVPSDMASPTPSEEARDKAEEIWVENIRVIEALRKMIADRLENGQYDSDEDSEMTDARDDEKPSTYAAEAKPAESLYPVLKISDDE